MVRWRSARLRCLQCPMQRSGRPGGLKQARAAIGVRTAAGGPAGAKSTLPRGGHDKRDAAALPCGHKEAGRCQGSQAPKGRGRTRPRGAN